MSTINTGQHKNLLGASTARKKSPVKKPDWVPGSVTAIRRPNIPQCIKYKQSKGYCQEKQVTPPKKASVTQAGRSLNNF